MKLTRREIIKAGGVFATAYFLPRGARRALAGPATEKVLVAIFLRGGADPLNLVVPAFDADYYLARPNIKVVGELDLGGGDTHGFGFFPLCTNMKQMYDAEELLAIHLAGSTDPSRSHFDAQDFMEKAAPGDKGVTNGWLNRYLGVINNADPIAGLSISDAPQLALRGSAPNVAFSAISEFLIQGQFATERQAALQSYYAGGASDTIGAGVDAALSAVDIIQSVNTSTGVTYPSNKLGKALKDVAAIIKAEVGVKVVAVDLGGWDHHSNLNTQLGDIGEDGDGKAVELDTSLRAFRDDLYNSGGTNYLNHTLSLCMTEFGRRVAENGGAGTDHGHGGVMFAIGGGISGGRLVLKNDNWPGLKTGDLFNGEDLQVTTDFRNVFAEALFAHLGMNISAMEPVFPDFSIKQSNFPGLYG